MGTRFAESVTLGKPHKPPRLVGGDGAQSDGIYRGIEVEPDRWVELACEEAKRSVEEGGGPFGAVLLQVDDDHGEVIRYWVDHNRVAEQSDPTAHAEVMVIRAACRELGAHDLGTIMKSESALHQRGETSHCELYSSCEPCPMCYSAIRWARVPVLVFSATCAEASHPDVGFSDQEIYDDLGKDYRDRGIRVYHAASPRAMDAFELWKKTDNPRY